MRPRARVPAPSIRACAILRGPGAPIKTAPYQDRLGILLIHDDRSMGRCTALGAFGAASRGKSVLEGVRAASAVTAASSACQLIR